MWGYGGGGGLEIPVTPFQSLTYIGRICSARSDESIGSTPFGSPEVGAAMTVLHERSACARMNTWLRRRTISALYMIVAVQ